MNNKKWIIALILMFMIAGLAIGCALDPGFKGMVVGGLTGFTGAIYTPLAAGWASLGLIVGSSGLNFLIGFIAIFIIGFLGGTFLWKRAVPTVKEKLGIGQQQSASNVTLRGGPEAEVPVPVEQEKPKEVKAE